jgi:hypothetical protein
MYTRFPAYILRQADGALIPMDEGNRDYAAYLEWTETNTPHLPPQPSIAELILRAQAEMRVQRQPIIAVCDGLQASALAKGDTATALVIETAKQGLRDITKIVLTDCTSHEQMKAKVMARYVEIASASPALKAAFSEALR